MIAIYMIATPTFTCNYKVYGFTFVRLERYIWRQYFGIINHTKFHKNRMTNISVGLQPKNCMSFVDISDLRTVAVRLFSDDILVLGGESRFALRSTLYTVKALPVHRSLL